MMFSRTAGQFCSIWYWLGSLVWLRLVGNPAEAEMSNMLYSHVWCLGQDGYLGLSLSPWSLSI